jgi:hypothetical protein
MAESTRYEEKYLFKVDHHLLLLLAHPLRQMLRFASQMYSEYEKLENHIKYHNATDFIHFLGAY